jgi:hypothetical protein
LLAKPTHIRHQRKKVLLDSLLMVGFDCYRRHLELASDGVSDRKKIEKPVVNKTRMRHSCCNGDAGMLSTRVESRPDSRLKVISCASENFLDGFSNTPGDP